MPEAIGSRWSGWLVRRWRRIARWCRPGVVALAEGASVRSTAAAWARIRHGDSVAGPLSGGGVAGVGVIAAGRGRKPEIPQATIEAIVHDTLPRCLRTARPSGRPARSVSGTGWARTPWRGCGRRASCARGGSTRSSCRPIPASRRSSSMWSGCISTAGAGGGAVRRREASDPGVGSDPAELAVAAGSGPHHDPRLQAAGTTTIFAALDTATGQVLQLCKPRRRHQEFLSFLSLDRSAHPGARRASGARQLEHPLPPQGRGVARHRAGPVPRPLRPYSSSWLNLVERWFKEITDNASAAAASLRRRARRAIDDGQPTGTTTPDPSSGPRPPTRSSPSPTREPLSTTSPNPRRTTSPAPTLTSRFWSRTCTSSGDSATRTPHGAGGWGAAPARASDAVRGPVPLPVARRGQRALDRAPLPGR